MRDCPGVSLTPESISPQEVAAPPVSTSFTEEHEAFRRTVRAYVEKELAPHALEWDRAGHLPPRGLPAVPASWASSASTTIPAWGGSGLRLLVRDRVLRGAGPEPNAGVNMALLVQSQIATPIIGEVGTDEQKSEFLVPALAG